MLSSSSLLPLSVLFSVLLHHDVFRHDVSSFCSAVAADTFSHIAFFFSIIVHVLLLLPHLLVPLFVSLVRRSFLILRLCLSAWSCCMHELVCDT